MILWPIMILSMRIRVEPPGQGGVHLPQGSLQQRGHLLAGDQYHRHWAEPLPLDGEAGAGRFGESGIGGKVQPLAGKREFNLKPLSAQIATAQYTFLGKTTKPSCLLALCFVVETTANDSKAVIKGKCEICFLFRSLTFVTN